MQWNLDNPTSSGAANTCRIIKMHYVHSLLCDGVLCLEIRCGHIQQNVALEVPLGTVIDIELLTSVL